MRLPGRRSGRAYLEHRCANARLATTLAIFRSLDTRHYLDRIELGTSNNEMCRLP